MAQGWVQNPPAIKRELHAGMASILSVRTLQGLSERQMLSAASYPGVARLLRQSADAAARWFDRMVFNIVLGNTDDHALNHLFGWDGRRLKLMLVFDLDPHRW